MYARMVIGEALSEEQVGEFSRIYQSDVLPDLARESGFESASLMVEEGGNMAVSLTFWKTPGGLSSVSLEPVLSSVRGQDATSAGR